MDKSCGFKRVAMGAALGVVWWGVTAAQSEDVPLDLEADSIRYDYNTGTSVYEGNVVITQGGMRLTGDKVEVFSEDGELSRLVSRAAPSTFQSRSEEGDAGTGDVDASARRIEYDIRRRIIVFMGDAVVKDDEKVLSGERIVYDIEKRTVDAPRGKERVRLTITP